MIKSIVNQHFRNKHYIKLIITYKSLIMNTKILVIFFEYTL